MSLEDVSNLYANTSNLTSANLSLTSVSVTTHAPTQSPDNKPDGSGCGDACVGLIAGLGGGGGALLLIIGSVVVYMKRHSGRSYAKNDGGVLDHAAMNQAHRENAAPLLLSNHDVEMRDII